MERVPPPAGDPIAHGRPPVGGRQGGTMRRTFRRPSGWAVLVPVVALAAGLLFATSERTAQGTDLRGGEVIQLSGLIDQRDTAIARQQQELAGLQRQIQQQTKQAASRD